MEQPLPGFPKPLFIANSSFKYCEPGLRWRESYFRPLVIAFSVILTCIFTTSVRADLSNDRFGKINIYRTSTEPKGAVILFSSDSGFDNETEALANQITKSGLFVIGVNTPRYISGIANEDHDEDCSYLAGEITRLSQAVQSTEKFKEIFKFIKI